MGYLWILGGIATVTVTFLAVSDPLDPWPGLRGGAIAGGLYVLAMVIFTTRPPLSRRARISGVVLVLLFTASAAIYSTSLEGTSRWQKDELLQIRARLSRQMLASEMMNVLTRSLEEYYRQPARTASFQKAFEQVLPGAVVGEVVLRPEQNEHVVLVAISEEQIVLVGQSSLGTGWDPTFVNIDGSTGLPQVRAVMTKKGGSYGTEN